jgi:hypothetical protein
MINDQKPRGCQFETPFDHIQDVNELVLAARAYWAEKNEMSPELMDDDTADDTAMDFLLALLAGWIILREPVPVDSKERLTQIIEAVITALLRIQSALPDDQAELKKELRHMLRRQLVSRKSDSD